METATPQGMAARIATLEERLARQDQELAEARRQAEDAGRARAEVLSRLSHDLRAPLNAIIGYARIVLRRAGPQLEERQRRNLESIDASAQRLLDMISDAVETPSTCAEEPPS